MNWTTCCVNDALCTIVNNKIFLFKIVQKTNKYVVLDQLRDNVYNNIIVNITGVIGPIEAFIFNNAKFISSDFYIDLYDLLD